MGSRFASGSRLRSMVCRRGFRPGIPCALGLQHLLFSAMVSLIQCPLIAINLGVQFFEKFLTLLVIEFWSLLVELTE